MSIIEKTSKAVVQGPAATPSPRPPGPVAPPVLFSADLAGPAPADRSRAGFLADVMLHRGVATPLCIGLFGPAGAGKSSLLAATLDAGAALGQAAEAVGLATPFLSGTATLRIVAEPGIDPDATLLRQGHAGLAAGFPALAAGAVQALDDPESAAREADDRLSAARHRLDEERRRLDDLSARQARLLDAVLFEGTGSRLDAYARANRGRIDRILRGFGFADDTALAYKETVRDAAESGAGRGLGWAAAFWAYRGQLRLLLVAVAFFVAAWLAGMLLDDRQGLLEALRASSDKAGPVADWLGAHAEWLDGFRAILKLAGLAAIAMNVLRAVRFIQPVARGVTLLRGDLDARRHELDGLVAHQAQRVEVLAREADRAGDRAAEAGHRLETWTRPRAPMLPAAFAEAGPAAAARSFFAKLSDAIAAPGGASAGAPVPTRLLVTLDGFDRLPPRDAAAFLNAAHLCLARPGIVTLVAADRDHLANGLAETDPALARAILDRIVQVPVRLDGGDAPDWPGASPLVRRLLSPGNGGEPGSDAVAPDPGRSALDKPWLPKEAAVLEALAPFAGGTPRALKRFVNLYRIARADPALDGAGASDLAVLALGLALAGSGIVPPSAPLDGGSRDGTLQAARHAAATALGVALDLGRESRGLDVARRYAAS